MSLFDQLFPRRGSLASSQILEAVVKPNQSSQGGNDVSGASLLTFPSTTFKIERVGKVNVTVAANGVQGSANVSLSPQLPDSVLTNYVVMITVNEPLLTSAWSGAGRLQNRTTLQVLVNRAPNLNSSNATGVTVAGGALTDVSGMAVSNPEPGTVTGLHGSFLSIDHAHDAVGLHTVSDPTHTHTIQNNQAALTYNVDWVIMHI